MLFEWIRQFIAWMASSKSDEHEDLRRERDAAREDLKVVNRILQQQNQELIQRVETLETRLASVTDTLHREVQEHRECRTKLRLHEERIDTLQKQFQTLHDRMTRQEQENRDGGLSGI
jgi:chromosome segregation ATPase